MIVAVTGATGVLGRRLVRELLARAHSVRALSRGTSGPYPPEASWIRGDLETGEGLPDLLDEADAVIHSATSSRRHRYVDRLGTERLLDVAVRSGAPRVLYPGIVGCDIVPLGYYRSKLAVEDMIARSGLPWTVLRATQFHQLIWGLLALLSRPPAMLVPRDTRAQALDPAVVARLLVDAAESGHDGRLPDVGGPHAYEARELAASYLAAVGGRRRVVPVTVPGIVGASLRAGANLTPNRDATGMSWNDFVRRQMERAG